MRSPAVSAACLLCPVCPRPARSPLPKIRARICQRHTENEMVSQAGAVGPRSGSDGGKSHAKEQAGALRAAFSEGAIAARPWVWREHGLTRVCQSRGRREAGPCHGHSWSVGKWTRCMPQVGFTCCQTQEPADRPCPGPRGPCGGSWGLPADVSDCSPLRERTFACGAEDRHCRTERNPSLIPPYALCERRFLIAAAQQTETQPPQNTWGPAP